MKTICCIGAGNVAWHFATRWFKEGYLFSQVYSRNIKNAQELSALVNATPVDQFKEINQDADVYFFGISDDGLRAAVKVFKSLKHYQKIVLHCSGNVSSQILKEISDHHGVIYPFQSLRKKKEIYAAIPICITASSKALENKLKTLASSISKNIYMLNDEQRSMLQLTGVFSNNFITHLVYLTQKLLDDHDIDRSLLQPILAHTLKNLQHNNAYDAQTGPAVRGDQGTINQHLNLLADKKNLREIYQTLSNSINTSYHEDR